MDKLEQLQHWMRARLLHVEALQYASIFITRPRLADDGSAITAPMIQQSIEDALGGNMKRNGKAGGAIVILMPRESTVEHMQFGTTTAMQVEIIVRVVENILINNDPSQGSGLSAEAMAELVRSDLHGAGFAGLVLKGDEANGKYPVIVEDENLLVYEVKFTGQIKRPNLPRVLPVEASFGGGHLALRTDTPNASIYYTTDGTWPHPDDGATLYTGAITITEETTVLAMAYKDGHSPGNLMQRTFSP